VTVAHVAADRCAPLRRVLSGQPGRQARSV